MKPNKKTWTAQLKAIIQFFHDQTGMEFTVICERSISNSRLWKRLQDGGTVTLAIADHILDWLAGQGYYLTPEGEPYYDEGKNQTGRKTRAGKSSIEVRQ